MKNIGARAISTQTNMAINNAAAIDFFTIPLYSGRSTAAKM